MVNSKIDVYNIQIGAFNEKETITQVDAFIDIFVCKPFK